MPMRSPTSVAALALLLAALGAVAPVRAAKATAPRPSWASLRVRVEGFRSTDGQARLALFRGSDGFPDEPSRAVRASRIRIRGPVIEIVWSGLEPGSYALSFIHDENDDGRLNASWLGVPLEGGGFSRNAVGSFGPPSYEDAQLELHPGERLKTVLQMVYY